MAQLGRPGLLSSQKAEAGEQWKRGKSLSDMGCALGQHAGSIHGIIAANGGILPCQGDGLARPSRWRSEKRFREGLPGAIHPMHGRSTWVASFNGQSRNCPTWRAQSVLCRGGR